MRDPCTIIKTDAEQREDIWQDIERLRQWTSNMLLDPEIGEPRGSWEGHIRDVEERKRKWLHKLMRDDPVRFAELIREKPVRNWDDLISRQQARDLAKLVQKRPRGRTKGKHVAGLAEALSLKVSIQRTWKEAFGHAYGHKDLAFEIAAAWYGITVKQLRNYTKNR